MSRLICLPEMKIRVIRTSMYLFHIIVKVSYRNIDTASKGKHHLIKISYCDLDKISHTRKSALPQAGDPKAAMNRQESQKRNKLVMTLLYVIFYCEFVTFPISILGQVWYLIVLIPDLCTLTYFDLPGIALRQTKMRSLRITPNTSFQR